jgi:hypothetical protein
MNKLKILLIVLLLALGATTASADSESASFAYLFGSGFLGGLSPTACPQVASAANGETIEITGAGTLSIHPESVTGGGTFVHKDAAGTILESGGWTAMDLLSFNDYGTSPGFPSTFHGGLALIRVQLSPSSGGPGIDAILEENYAIGNPPAARTEDQVRLAVQGGGPNFNNPVSGFNVFIKLP